MPESTYSKLMEEWRIQLEETRDGIAAQSRANVATWEDNAKFLEAVSNS